MTKLTDEAIEIAAQEALRNSLGGPDSEVGRARLRNLEAYNAEAVGEFAPPEIEDRSDFVDTTVADTVNGILPQVMQMFVSSDDAVEFEGKGQPGSEQEAKLATAYINHLFYTENDGVSIVHDWFWDALTQKVGFVMVWAEDEAEDSRQSYEGQSQEQMLMLMQDGWELEDEPEVDEQGGLSFTVAKRNSKRAIKVSTVAPHEMRVDVNARWDAEPAVIGRVFYKRKFEWQEDGYDVSEVGGSTAGPTDEESLELLGGNDSGNFQPAHDSHALIKGAEIYMKLDADGDGIAEWLKICLIEEKLAHYEDGTPAWEKVDGHPFVWICPNPRPHSFWGDCPADFAIQPQRLRTHTIRAIQDNMLLAVNQRIYVNTRANVNIDDVLDNRAGGVIRGEGPPGDALLPVAAPVLDAPAYQFNEYIGSWAENRTGFNRYSAGTDANALNKTARGTELLTAKADMRMGLMARHFAVGMRKLFAKMLGLAIKYQNAPEMVAIHGQFVPINPGEFRNQFRVKINVGLGTGTKEQQAARIMGLVQMLQMGAQAGVVRPQHLSEAIRLYVEANEFRNPERFVDPEPSGMPPSPEAYNAEKQQAMQQMQELQQQLEQMAQENQGLKAEKAAKEGDLALAAAKLELEDRKLSIEAARAGAELELRSKDAQRADRDSEMKGAETAQRMHRADSESSEIGQLKEQVAALMEAVGMLIQAKG